MHELMTSQFWLGLGAIIWGQHHSVGDNAVVIALAAARFAAAPAEARDMWGAGGGRGAADCPHHTWPYDVCLKLSFLKLISDGAHAFLDRLWECCLVTKKRGRRATADVKIRREHPEYGACKGHIHDAACVMSHINDHRAGRVDEGSIVCAQCSGLLSAMPPRGFPARGC